MSRATGKWSYDNEGPEQSAHLSVSSRHIRALWPGYLLFAYEKPAFCLFESFRPASVPQSNARPTGDQEVAGSIPAGSGNSLSWRLIMK